MPDTTTLEDRFNGVINPETAPGLITITFNQCETRLMKIGAGASAPHFPGSSISDELKDYTYWVGTPVGLKSGLTCQHPLFIIPWGEDKYPRVEGSSALDFIAWKGEVPLEEDKKTGRKRRTRPGRWASSNTRNEFTRNFISFCVLNVNKDVRQGLIETLAKRTGLTPVPGKMTKTQRQDLAFMGIKSDIIGVAMSNDLQFEYNIADWMGRKVSPAYAMVEEGDWDIESAGVAATSNLFDSQVLLMQKHNLRFKRKFSFAKFS